MRRFVAALFAAGTVMAYGPSHAQDVHVGVVTSLTGQLEVLGTQLRDGARVAAEEAGVRVTVVDDGCTADGGAEAARRMRQAEVDIVTGFLCTEAIEAALPLLGEAGIPVITPAVRALGLTDRRERAGWLVWRLAPRDDAERTAVAQILSRRWRDVLFAIVDDGTIYGRELAETLRLAAQTAALEPAFVDTYRPQSENQIGLVGRLARAGATHTFVGGDRDDIAIMGRDAAELGHDITFAGGEALRSAGEVPVAEGTLMVALPEWGDFVDEDTMERFAQREIIPEGYVLPAYAAVEIAIDAVRRSDAERAALPDVLGSASFETIIGAVQFDAKGDLTTNPFRLFRYDGERFVPAE